ncbi:MAG TPA: hypothetical protein VK866_06550 [Acidimicrobiales bacterium]|nr:hypothetical protein [Acidimicrobiales bacterium]
MTRHRSDRGQVAGIEVLPFGFLVFVVATLVLANAWSIVDARLAVGAAAREGGRAAVERDDPDAAVDAATTLALDVLAGHGGRLEDPTVAIAVDGQWRRCARVTVTVAATVPAVALPFVKGLGTRQVRADHTELVDPFRGGLAGTAACDG